MSPFESPAQPEHLLVRSVFISDFHLGTRGARFDLLLDFLAHVKCEHLYLVGDVFDIWRLRKVWHWHAGFDQVVRAVLAIAAGDTRVTYIPGNHDEVFREWLGQDIAGVMLRGEAVHEGADGRKFLILHGDEFDGVIRHAKFLAHLGDWSYNVALVVSGLLNRLRLRLGYPYWSLSQWLKRQVKGAVKAMDRFEAELTAVARKRGLDGVICGHIHQAEARLVDGILYMNAGDWVESCTALVEHPDGSFELLDWRHQASTLREALPA
jgi:UDP-2,3-diacylglucosamine pyrophosphatase LpxH